MDDVENPIADAFGEDSRSESGRSTISSSGEEQESNNGETAQNEQVDQVVEMSGIEDNDEDEWTWDERSSSSDDVDLKEEDPWFPLERRKNDFPNVFNPNKTCEAYSLTQNYKESSSDSDDDFGDNMSENDDEEFQKYKDVLCPYPTKEELANLVLEYLTYHGYVDVLEPFCNELNVEISTEDIDLMKARYSIKEFISKGNIENAINKLNDCYPELLNQNTDLNFRIRKQHIVEMIRARDLEKAMFYAREHFRTKKIIESKRLEELEKTLALMAYDVTDESPFHYLYDQKEREKLSKYVNCEILSSVGRSKYSRLDMLMKTITMAVKDYGDNRDVGSSADTWGNRLLSPDGLQLLLGIFKGSKTKPAINWERDLC